MKRLLLILCILLMPLQSSWAGVMSYGQHAVGEESTEYCRQASKALDQVESNRNDGSTQSVQYGNCTLCELGHFVLSGSEEVPLSLASPPLVESSLDLHKPSPYAAPPDRPQWSLHA